MAASPARSVTKLPLAESRPLPARSSSVSPEELLPAHPHVGEEQLAGGGGVQPHLPERLGLIETGRSLVQHEREHLAIADRRVGSVVELGVEDDGVGVGAVGDERLVAVEDVLVTVPPGGRLHPAQGVRSRVGLGDGPGSDLVAGHEIEAPPLHLGRRAQFHDGAAGQPDADAHGGHDARAVVAHLDDRDEGHGRRTAVAPAARPCPFRFRRRRRRPLPCARAGP